MLRLDKAFSAWGTPGFVTILKQEIENMDVEYFPLQQGLVNSNYVADTQILRSCVMINSIAEPGNVVSVRAGISNQGVLVGCSCEDDPTPTSENNEYCEIILDIDKLTAAFDITFME